MGKTFTGKNKNKGYQIKKKDIEKRKQEEQARKGRKSNGKNREVVPTIDPNGIKEFERLMEEKNKKAAQVEDEREM